jgi:hypothetical protein
LGRPVLANEIFDPTTARRDPVTGNLVEDPFPGNIIPSSRFDPVAVKIQNQIPLPSGAGFTNNLLPIYTSVRHTTIPGVKMDHQINEKQHLSFYWSFTHTDSPYSPIYGQSEGLPPQITADRGTFIHSHVERLNYDNTLSPTLLLHIGVGYQQNNFFDDAPVLDFNAAQTYGLVGATLNRNVPVFTGFCPPAGIAGVACTQAGGMYNMGPVAGQGHQFYEKPSANTSLTWVRGNHSYKVGAEMYFLAIPSIPYTGTNGVYNFSASETNQPYLVGQNFGGLTAGFPYASFLLGAVDSYSIAAQAEFRQSKSQWGVFIQDSWKISRKLTMDYGLRWDYGTYFSEEHGRASNFSPVTPNPKLGGYPGAFLFEGSGTGHCDCSFAHNYPFALGPRLGIAYQADQKTVIRGGFGVIYNQVGTTQLGYAAAGVATTANYSSPGLGQPAMTLTGGIPPQNEPQWPVFSNGIFPSKPIGNQPLPAGIGMLDPNAGRPARQMQWSLSIQREIFRDLVVQASYVGNLGAWWNSTTLENLNALTPQMLAARGLNVNSAADEKLLASPLSSALAQQRGFSTPPYPGFAASQLVAQSLRPFPQFGNIPIIGAPLGRTWYDALQLTATKRFSHGIVFNAAYTFQKSLSEGLDSNINTVTPPNNNWVGATNNYALAKSISSFDQPQVFQIAGRYTLPRLQINKFASYVIRDWEITAFLNYSSGLPIPVPAATTNLATSQLFQPTVADRVPGVPLYTTAGGINCGCYDPSKTFILNQAAWVNPPQGTFGNSSPFYTDFRYARHPIENMGLGRLFVYRERFSLEMRVEFNNIFNRTYLNNPSVANFSGPQGHYAAGPLKGLNSGGFGYINLAVSPTTPNAQPRNGTIVLRVRF